MGQLAPTNASPKAPSPRSWVMHRIIGNIQKGHYVVGQPLPSTRRLSQELSISRGTVKRAFALLEEEGYLKIGENGTRIVTPRTQQSSGFVSKSIVVLIQPLELWPEGHHEPGWIEMTDRGVFDGIRAAGLHSVSLNPWMTDEATIIELTQNRPRGIVLGELASHSPKTVSALNTLRESGLPVVAYGDAPELAPFDRVTSNHESGAYSLTKWLLSKGCKRIAMLFADKDRGLYWTDERIRGCRRALEEAGLPSCEPVYTPPPEQVDSRENFDANVRVLGGHLLEHLGSNRADAILCVSDSFVFSAAAAVRLAGHVPNKDIMLAGYDNYWHEARGRQFDAVEPAATVDKLNHVIGREMVKLLLERIDGNLPHAPQRRVVMPKMIVTEEDCSREGTRANANAI